MLAVAVVALRGRWDAVGDAGGLPGLGPSVAAVLIFAVANALLAATWRGVLQAAGSTIGLRAAMWVWAASQLARYSLSAAQVAGRAVLGRRYGLTRTAGAFSALVEIGWQTSISAVLVLGTLPWWLGAGPELTWLAWAGLLPAAVLLVGLVAPNRLLQGVATALGWGPLARLIRGRLSGLDTKLSLSRGRAARLTVRYAVNSALRLVGFLVLFSALGGDLSQDWLLAVGAASLGQLVGRLAVFAPGGLGPRESATALVVAQVIGGAPALMLVAATRLLELIAEFLFLAVGWLLRPQTEPQPAAVNP